jgi:RNA polymerase sigma-70 factor (ECF subfamily)
MMKERTDTDLVRDTLSGRMEAFGLLVRRHQDRAHAVAVALLSDFDLARDVTQDAFLRSYRGLAGLREPERFGAWLRGIVRRTAFQALRELNRVRALAEDLRTASDEFDPRPSPHTRAEEAEREALVFRALDRLGETAREAVILHYLEGLSYAEIAEQLEVSEAAVLGRLQRARARLRKELAIMEETFSEKKLPEDFADEVRKLLEQVAEDKEERARVARQLAEMGEPAVEPLCHALEDPRDFIRDLAARALCHIGDARALGPLLRGLYGAPSLNWSFFRSGLPLKVPGVREALMRIVREEDDPEKQYRSPLLLAHCTGDDEVFDLLYSVFRGEGLKSAWRGCAFEALCKIRPERAPELIEEAFRSDDDSVRSAAAWRAGSLGIVPSIEACLENFDRAGHFLLRHGEEGRNLLRDILRNGSRSQQATAAHALAETRDPEAFEILKRELLGTCSDTPRVKSLCGAVARWYGKEFLAWLQEEPPDFGRNPALAWTLSRIPGEEGLMWMEKLSREGTPTARGAAIRRLARERGAAFVPELRKLLREGKPKKVMRVAYREMLRREQDALPTVLEMLESEHWPERKSAVVLLRRWGRLTPEQAARAKNDPHPAVRRAAGR